MVQYDDASEQADKMEAAMEAKLDQYMDSLEE